MSRASPATRSPEQTIFRDVPATDPIWKCNRRVEIVTRGPDQDLTGIGGSGWRGDLTSLGVVLPAAPSNSGTVDGRYLVRLAGIEIPYASGLILRGFRQYLTIKASVTDSGTGFTRVFERAVETPNWRFQDGNVSWHIVYQPAAFSNRELGSAQAVGTSPGLAQGLDAALLYHRNVAGVYIPAVKGTIPGVGIENLGTMNEIREPWNRSNSFGARAEFIQGPGALVFYASVYQPNPETRSSVINSLTGPQFDAIAPEDRFVEAFSNTAIYGRIAGSLFVELFPCCAPSTQRRAS